VAVLGATGVYGRHLVPRLVEHGYQVRALARRPEAATAAAACGAEVIPADIFDLESLVEALNGCDVGINIATSLPSPARDGGDYAANDVLRREGTPIWVRACQTASVARVLQQSIALVNSFGREWADEDSYLEPDDSVSGEAIAACRSMEQSIADSGLDWTVFRGGLFYGPGTGFDDDWFARARAGKLRVPGDGEDYVSLVHIADMADATIAALARWPSRQTLIVADGAPARWRELFDFIARTVGGDEPETGGRLGLPSCRVRNQRALDALPWTPSYANYRAGLAR
jgi:nucleoside-diphosphate-sugar epimerase